MKPIVYVDILFLLNFFINTTIIYISFLLIKQELKLWRLILSAIFLSLYACIIFFPSIGFIYSILGKITALIIACLIACPTKSVLKLAKNAAVLFFSTAILGGIVFVLIFATNLGTSLQSTVSNGEFYFNVKASTLLISILLAYACVYIITEIKKSAQLNEAQITNISIYLGENQITAKGFLDTGCTLREPISSAPAIIVNSQISKQLLEGAQIPEKYLSRYRLIPYSTISNKNGLLSGIFPDKVEIEGKTVKKCIIAFSTSDLCPDKSFDALLGTELLYETKISERTHTL